MTEQEDLDRITENITGAAIEVHRALGPGLLESAYEACLTFELAQRGLKVEQQKLKVLKDGIRRVVNHFPDSLRSPRALR